MKKTTIFLLVLIGMNFKSAAQIPNNGFENWTTVGNSTEPTGWHSIYSLMDSSGTYCPVTKSTDHYPATIGNFSARIANDTARWNSANPPGNMLGWGFITSTKADDKPLFPVTGHPKSLCGYYKFLPQNGDTMNIDFHFYKNGAEITMGNFQSNVTASSWTPFKVFVTDTLYNSVDSARVGFGSCNEPKNGHGGPRGNSALYIDNLSFDNLITSSSSVEKLFSKNMLFDLYPNPATDFVSFNIDNTNNADLTLTVYNVMGKIVKSETLQQNQKQINVKDLSRGIYFVEIKSKDWTGKQKLIIRR